MVAKNYLDILNAIKLTLKFNNVGKRIDLHEPYFEDTNAIKYLKDCVDTCWVSSSGGWVKSLKRVFVDLQEQNMLSLLQMGLLV